VAIRSVDVQVRQARARQGAEVYEADQTRERRSDGCEYRFSVGEEVKNSSGRTLRTTIDDVAHGDRVTDGTRFEHGTINYIGWNERCVLLSLNRDSGRM
jgi:hypothetical protein